MKSKVRAPNLGEELTGWKGPDGSREGQVLGMELLRWGLLGGSPEREAGDVSRGHVGEDLE